MHIDILEMLTAAFGYQLKGFCIFTECVSNTVKISGLLFRCIYWLCMACWVSGHPENPIECIMYIIVLTILHVGPEKRIYHKYDTVVYPKKTQISKSWTEKVADYASRFKGWLTRKKQTGGSKEEEEFVPLDFHDMSVFCFQSYLEKYKDIVCEGRFQQGTNIVEIVNSVAHVFNSLLSFAVFTQGYGSRTVLEQVPDTNKYREVCDNNIVYCVTLIIRFRK